MSTITISRRLEVSGNGKLLVPGCEPTSAISSVTLMAQQKAQGLCRSAIVSLQDALSAIPGSFLEFGSNYGSPRKRWFVLPGFDPESCPCTGEEDWYGVLRSLAQEEAPVTERFDSCNTIGMGFCPSPDFKTNAVGPYGRAQDGGAPFDSYVEEGTNDILSGRYYTP